MGHRHAHSGWVSAGSDKSERTGWSRSGLILVSCRRVTKRADVLALLYAVGVVVRAAKDAPCLFDV